MTDAERYNRLLIRALQQNVLLEPKASKWYWRTLNMLLTIISFGKIDFMHRFHTTIGNRIGTASSWDRLPDAAKYEILLHEMKHVEQYKRFGFGNVWLGAAITGIGYLFLPFPIGIAWCRAAMEKEAYAESIRAMVQLRGRNIAATAKEHIVSQFTSVNYLFMWPFRKHMEKWFDETLDRVCREEGVE